MFRTVLLRHFARHVNVRIGWETRRIPSEVRNQLSCAGHVAAGNAALIVVARILCPLRSLGAVGIKRMG